MNNIQRNLFYISFAICSLSVFAQKENKISNISSDSMNTVFMEAYNKKLTELEQQKRIDSLKRLELEARIKTLKTTDNLKRQKLEEDLSKLRVNDIKRIEQKKYQIEALRKTSKSYPVIGLLNDTLFNIYSKSGSFSAKERADAFSSRIRKLADIPDFNNKTLRIIKSETTIDIVENKNVIMSISENDALWANSSQINYATYIKNKIIRNIEDYQSETSFSTMAKKIALAVLVILISLLLIRYITRLFKWLAVKIKDQEGKLIKDLKFKNYVFSNTTKQIKILLWIGSFLKWVFILIAIYISLLLLFGIFPWTRSFAKTLFNYILNPIKSIAIGFWDYLPKLFAIIVIFIIFYYILKGLRFFKTEIESGRLTISGFYADWANPTYQILRVLLYAFMFVTIFPYLPGSNSSIFKGVSVFLGVLFTFGSSGSINNVIAGLILTYMRTFKIGDRIKIGDVTGDVIEKTLLVTRIRTIKNEIISIPNSNVMNSHTTNYSNDITGTGLIVHTTVTIGYDAPWPKVHKALIDAALRTEYLLREPEPFVLQTSLDDFYVSYQINAYTHNPNEQALIYSDLHQNIQDCFNETGIEIMSPHYRAERDGNATTIPADYLDKDYASPSFNVKVKREDHRSTIDPLMPNK